MRKQISPTKVDAILNSEKVMSRLHEEKNHLKRLIQENRLLDYRISAIDQEYCSTIRCDVHEASYSEGILTHQYLIGKKVFYVKVGKLPLKGGF